MSSLIVILMLSASFAHAGSGRSMLTVKPDSSSTALYEPNERKTEQAAKAGGKSVGKAQATAGNLPPEYGRKLSGLDVNDRVMYSPKSNLLLDGIRTGMAFKVLIDRGITVSQNVPNPVSAVVLAGRYKGSLVSGDAILDKDLKRVLIDFTEITIKGSNDVYSFKGKALGTSGVGIVGNYHNQSAKFILGEFASAALAGYLDSGVTRSQTISGNYVTEPSAANAAKSGAVAALSKSTERFAEAARSTSDYSDTNALIEIEVIVKDDPVLKNN